MFRHAKQSRWDGSCKKESLRSFHNVFTTTGLRTHVTKRIQDWERQWAQIIDWKNQRPRTIIASRSAAIRWRKRFTHRENSKLRTTEISRLISIKRREKYFNDKNLRIRILEITRARTLQRRKKHSFEKIEEPRKLVSDRFKQISRSNSNSGVLTQRKPLVDWTVKETAEKS